MGKYICTNKEKVKMMNIFFILELVILHSIYQKHILINIL
jgi:hypothetical protein